MQRDLEQIPKRRRLSEGGEGGSGSSGTSKYSEIKNVNPEDKSLRPGNKENVDRARVPMPSTKEYLVRPEWESEIDISKVCFSSFYLI